MFLYYVKNFGIITGLWKLDDSKMGHYIKLSYRIYSNIFYLINIISCILLVYTYPELFEDSVKLLDSSLFIIMWIVANLKIYYLRSEKMSAIFKTIMEKEKYFERQDDSEEKNIFENYKKKNLAVSKFYNWMILFGGSEYVAAQIYKIYMYSEDDPVEKVVLTKRPMLMLFRLPFDMEKHYNLAYVVHLIAIFVFVLYFSACAMILFAQLIFVLSELKLLQYRLANIEKVIVKSDKVSTEQGVYTELRNCVLRHKIIQLLDDVNETTEIPMIFTFLSLSLQLALALIRFQILKEPLDIVYSVVNFVACTIGMFIFCYLADNILIESNAISSILFEKFQWYKHNKKINNMVMIMMMRAQKPLVLNMGPFGCLSLEVFLKICKGTYSYLTFLRTMKKD